MSVDAALTAGRAAAESLMLDTFTAYAYTWTTVDGLQEQTWTAQGTTPGKLPNRRNGAQATAARTVTVGGVERVVVEGGLHLPWAAAPQVGWEYVLTTAGPRTHPSAVGRRFRVVEAPLSDDMTAWRLDVVDVTPEEA